jgi:hypothetical protein
MAPSVNLNAIWYLLPLLVVVFLPVVATQMRCFQKPRRRAPRWGAVPVCRTCAPPSAFPAPLLTAPLPPFPTTASQYNILKLTAARFAWDGASEYMDMYARQLYGGMIGNQATSGQWAGDSNTTGFHYMLPLVGVERCVSVRV